MKVIKFIFKPLKMLFKSIIIFCRCHKKTLLKILKLIFFVPLILRELLMSYESKKTNDNGFSYEYRFKSRKIIGTLFAVVFTVCIYIVIMEALALLKFVEETLAYMGTMGRQKTTVIKEFMKLYQNGTPVTNVLSVSFILSLGGMVATFFGFHTWDRNNSRKYNGVKDETV